MIEEMSPQEIFTKVKEHLLKQNARSMNENGSCKFRGENGLKCALGCLIPDDEYSIDMEDQSILVIFGVDTWRKNKEFHAKTGTLLSALQIIHDNFEPCEWEQSLQALAKSRGLKYD